MLFKYQCYWPVLLNSSNIEIQQRNSKQSLWLCDILVSGKCCPITATAEIEQITIALLYARYLVKKVLSNSGTIALLGSLLQLPPMNP